MWWAVLIAILFVIGVECLKIGTQALNSSQHPKRSWVEFERSHVEAQGGNAKLVDEARCIRILSYNVLGPLHGLASKHGYCPLTLRRWTNRSVRLKEEITSYHNAKPGGLHAVCLQEVTPRTLRRTWVPFMKTLGLERHVYQTKDPFPRRLGVYSDRCLGVAIFYSTRHFDKTAEMCVFFPKQVWRLRADNSRLGDGEMVSTRGNDERASSPATSRLEQDLNSKSDAAVMIRLRVKGEGEGEGKSRSANSRVKAGDGNADSQPSITLVNCHLWYDPVRPDLKTAQCKLLFDAIRRFHDKCGVTPGNDDVVPLPGVKESSLDRSSEKGQDGLIRDTAAANLVLCGDFNSVPFVNPEFLPGLLKPRAEATARSKERAPPGGFSTAGGIHPTYPSSEQTASGVYSLLTYGHVSASHAEHPDAFIPELVRLEEARDYVTVSQAERRRWITRQVAPLPHRPTGAWHSGFGSTLEDVYRDIGGSAPRFTTKTSSDFSGVIDHIFVSSRERNSGLVVRGVLGFPEGADMTPRIGTEDVNGGVEKQENKVLSESVGQPDGDGVARPLPSSAENTPPREFEPIPNEIWGSDHLALGVEIGLLSTRK